jgi:hypothetical protein
VPIWEGIDSKSIDSISIEFLTIEAPKSDIFPGLFLEVFLQLFPDLFPHFSVDESCLDFLFVSLQIYFLSTDFIICLQE